MDTQLIEIVGRNRLVNELLRSGLEVAVPARDRGVDLIAYADLHSTVSNFIARPIQMKAATGSYFSIDRKYERLRDLILAFVWNLDDSSGGVTYAMSYPEAVEIGDALGWTQTVSWMENNTYTTTRPSRELKALLERYRMNAKGWWTMVTGLP
jgi:hypothetical protein